MYLVVGLGNPGNDYYDSRHNVGFRAVDELADRIGLKLVKKGYGSLYNIGKINDKKVLLIKPQTYMNNSGIAVSQVRNFYKVETKNIIVIHDEMDLPIERIKIKRNGGSAGHNGIKSIVQHLETSDFARIRIGVGKPADKGKGAKHVLSSFSKSEKDKINQVIKTTTYAVEKIIENGIEKAMNEFNVKPELNIEIN